MNNSQEWNVHWSLPSSQEFVHRLSSTPGKVLPPTPSNSSGQSILSNSWSGRSLSQQTPGIYSQGPVGQPLYQANAREGHFLKELRFALHAVLSIVRDLPEKLRDVVTDSINIKDSSGKDAIEAVQKQIEGMLIAVEKILALAEASVDYGEKSRKGQDSLQKSVTEIEDKVDCQAKDVASLKGSIICCNRDLKRQLQIIKKTCINKLGTFHNLLLDINRSHANIDFSALTMKMEALLSAVESLPEKYFTLCENYLSELTKKENENALKLAIISKQVSGMKTILDSYSDVISAAVKKGLQEYNGEMKSNVRINRSLWPGNSPLIRNVWNSPVAFVTPQRQKEATKIQFASAVKSVTSIDHTVRSQKRDVDTFDVIDFESSSQESLGHNICKRRKITAGIEKSYLYADDKCIRTQRKDGEPLERRKETYIDLHRSVKSTPLKDTSSFVVENLHAGKFKPIYENTSDCTFSFTRHSSRPTIERATVPSLTCDLTTRFLPSQ